MKLKIERYSIKLFPENEIEEAYIEEVLELYKDQDTGTVKRVDASNLLSIAYLEIRQTKGEVTSDQDRIAALEAIVDATEFRLFRKLLDSYRRTFCNYEAESLKTDAPEKDK